MLARQAFSDRLVRRVCLVAVGLVFPLAAPSVATASRAPTAGERAAISRAVYSSPRTRLVPDKAFAVVFIRISTVGPWAKGELVARRGYAGVVQPATVVLSRSVLGWSVRAIGGSDSLICTVSPRMVARDLAIACPPFAPSRRACGDVYRRLPGLFDVVATGVSCLTARSIARAYFANVRPVAYIRGFRCTYRLLGGDYADGTCTGSGGRRISFRFGGYG